MALLKLDDIRTRPVALVATGLFLSLSILYFLPVEIPHKIAFPLFSAFVFSLWLTPWQMSAGLLMSAAGDYFGSCGIFLAQMGCFAAAHIFYIWFLIRRWLQKVEHDRKLTAKVKGQAMMFLILVLGLLAVAFTKIVPCVQDLVIRCGVIIYAILICIMLFFALMQRSSLYALGAVLFVFSDFILAWNKFTEPIEYSRYLIMIPYFIGQWLLFIRSTPYRVKTGIRTLRF